MKVSRRTFVKGVGAVGATFAGMGLAGCATSSQSSESSSSKVETDVLTTELWHYRRHLTPVIERICSTFLRNSGSSLKPNVVWDDITLQDEVENARARLYSAQAKALEKEEKTD